MSQKGIQQKVEELKGILAKHYKELGKWERELFKVINEYQQALDEEKLKEIRESLH